MHFVICLLNEYWLIVINVSSSSSSAALSVEWCSLVPCSSIFCTSPTCYTGCRQYNSLRCTAPLLYKYTWTACHKSIDLCVSRRNSSRKLNCSSHGLQYTSVLVIQDSVVPVNDVLTQLRPCCVPQAAADAVQDAILHFDRVLARCLVNLISAGVMREVSAAATDAAMMRSETASQTSAYRCSYANASITTAVTNLVAP